MEQDILSDVILLLLIFNTGVNLAVSSLSLGIVLLTFSFDRQSRGQYATMKDACRELSAMVEKMYNAMY